VFKVILVFFGGPAGNVNVNLRRTDRDAKNARNESRNEMNASVEFAAGRSVTGVMPQLLPHPWG